MTTDKAQKIFDTVTKWVAIGAFVFLIVYALTRCSSYEVVKKTGHPRYEPTKERHGGGKTTLE